MSNVAKSLCAVRFIIKLHLFEPVSTCFSMYSRVERKKVHGLTALRVPRTPYLQYHGVRSYLVQGTPLYLLRGTPLYLLRGTPLYLCICKDLDRVGLWIVHVA